MPEDRIAGLPLSYPEAVLLTNPTNSNLTGEVRYALIHYRKCIGRMTIDR